MSFLVARFPRRIQGHLCAFLLGLIETLQKLCTQHIVFLLNALHFLECLHQSLTAVLHVNSASIVRNV